MKKIIEKLKKSYNSDLIIKQAKNIYVIYLESLASSDKVNDYILKELSFNNSLISSPNSTVIKENEIDFYLQNGFAIVIIKKEIVAIEVRAEIFRSISIPTTEPSMEGPKDSFNENYQTNLGLIKKRIKTDKLKIDKYTLGEYTNTTTSVLYIKDLVNEEILQKVNNIISNIDLKCILDASNISEILENKKTGFPTIIKTERPDVAAYALMEGKIIILVDTSPLALILPAYLVDFINPKSDNYQKSQNINFIKILRIGSFILSMILPAFYISVINYNQEAIPLNLLISFATQRDGVPFPGLAEAVAMLIICEILRESDLRFPNSYGSAVSVLGALILGEAAVSAGIVSPIMIIVIAMSFICSLIFTDYQLVNALRHYRFICLFLSAFYGIIGLTISLIYFISSMNNINNFSTTYLYPIAPYNKHYFNKSIIKNKGD